MLFQVFANFLVLEEDILNDKIPTLCWKSNKKQQQNNWNARIDILSKRFTKTRGLKR